MPSAALRAVASSIASGMPSSWAHSSPTTDGSASNVASSVRARSKNKATASEPAAPPVDGATRESPDSGTTRSLGTPMRARLVVSTSSPLVSPSSAVRNSAASSTRCSQLSSTRSDCPGRNRANTASRSVCPGRSITPSTDATVCTKNPGRVLTSSTNDAPNGKVGASCRATSPASRVLPAPPGPSSVTSRESASDSSSSACSRARPMNGVQVAGNPRTTPEPDPSAITWPGASAASACRSVTASLRSSDETCVSTVRTDTCSREAICAFDRCSPSAASTSSSRSDSPAVPCATGSSCRLRALFAADRSEVRSDSVLAPW